MDVQKVLVLREPNAGRVPVVAVTGVNGKTTTTRLIAHALTLAGRRVGMTCTEGIYVGGHCLEAGDCSGPCSARTVLRHPDVEAAVLETARGGILREGLGFDRCDVAVVTNVGEGDHLGCGGVETVEQLARVKRLVVEAVRPGGAAVLNAADPLVAAMAGHCGAAVTYFARSPSHPVLAAHRAADGRVAFVRGGRVVLAEGERETPVASLRRVPLTGGGRVGFQVENVLAAVAAAWNLGVGLRAIRAALRSFASDVEHAPARFNLLQLNGAVAVLDYGHNPSSLSAILETLSQFPPGRRTAVYSAAGDRRDADLLRQGALLGDAFDRVILYEDANVTRGREPGEIIGLFRRGLAGRSRAAEVLDVQGAVRAVDLALSSARPGELLLVQVDVVEETLELVRGYLAGGAAREISWEEALCSLSGGRRLPARGGTSLRPRSRPGRESVRGRWNEPRAS